MLTDISKSLKPIGIRSAFFPDDRNMFSLQGLIAHAKNLGIDAAIKIGGVEAERDISDAISIGANSLIVPMIESDFAVNKFYEVLKENTPKGHEDPVKVSLMVETMQGFLLVDGIIQNAEKYHPDSIIIGREDLAKSLGLPVKEVNTQPVTDLILPILKKIKGAGIEICIGGGVNDTLESMEFLLNQSKGLVDRIELRKFTCSMKNATKETILDIIKKSAEFENAWFEYKLDILRDTPSLQEFVRKRQERLNKQ